jgi:phosphate transport system substrate-binding protein
MRRRTVAANPEEEENQMPRNGKLVRIALGVAAAAVVATLAVVSAGAASAKSTGATLNGAGSSFVAPLVQAWKAPVQAALGMTVNYSAVGSGAGIAAITGRTVDFGASDAPLTSSQFNSCGGCIQVPWALASTSVFYNLPGSKTFLHMSGPVLAKIYLGKITTWNNPAIKKLNPGKNLPNKQITVVHRSDGSGTSYNFTDYLSHVSPTWKSQVGRGTAVQWPTGVGAPHSSGVANVVRQTPGAIGYAETSYPIKNHLPYFAMQNSSGVFTRPVLKGIAAAARLDTHPNKAGALSIVDPPKSKKYKNAYPISTYTYVLLAKKSKQAAALKQLVKWAITKGQKYGPKLFFEPLPKSVVKFDQKHLKLVHS